MATKRAKKNQPKQRRGPFWRGYSKKLNKWLWGLDIRVSDGAGGKKKRIRPLEFETREEAERALANIRRQEREGKYGLAPSINRPTLHSLIAKRLPVIVAKSERTRARRVLFTWLTLLDSRIKLDKKFHPVGEYHSPVKVDDLKSAHLRTFIEKRQGDGQCNNSINRELTIIAATLNQAGEHFAELEQWKKPKIPKLKVAKSRRERLVSDDEYSRLISHLRRPAEESEINRRQDREAAYQARLRVAQIFEFAMITGARHGEIVKLKWMDISWERGKVLIYQGKTDEYKEIPLVCPLAAVIKERQPAKWMYVFTRGGNIYPRFYKILRKACEDLGIPYGKNIEDGLILHTARHTLTTKLIEAGLDYDTIGMITGHKAKELIAHYGHKHPGSVARAAAALEQISVRNGEDPERLDK